MSGRVANSNSIGKKLRDREKSISHEVGTDQAESVDINIELLERLLIVKTTD